MCLLFEAWDIDRHPFSSRGKGICILVPEMECKAYPAAELRLPIKVVDVFVVGCKQNPVLP